MLAVIVVYEGVDRNEFDAFECVLQRTRDVEVVVAGRHRGAHGGAGGRVVASASFDEITDSEIVVVPGGLGCDRAATDPALTAFLQQVGARARCIASSSTGSVALAAAGLLHGHAASTHWLAGERLERYGSASAGRRLVERGNVITCSGAMSALEAALLIAERVEGSSAVDRIKAELIANGESLLRPKTRWTRLLEMIGVGPRVAPAAVTPSPVYPSPVTPSPVTPSHGVEFRSVGGPQAGSSPPPTPLPVLIELVEDEALVRRLRKADRRRSGR